MNQVLQERAKTVLGDLRGETLTNIPRGGSSHRSEPVEAEEAPVLTLEERPRPVYQVREEYKIQPKPAPLQPEPIQPAPKPVQPKPVTLQPEQKPVQPVTETPKPSPKAPPPAPLPTPVVKEPVTMPVVKKPIVRETIKTPVKPMTTKTVQVMDAHGNPLPGANVYFDAANGTTTDYNGIASISNTDPGKVLTISYMGFKPQRFVLGELPVSVKLSMGETLGEVVVTAPKTKKSMAGYVLPAIGGIALIALLFSLGGNKPKEVTL